MRAVIDSRVASVLKKQSQLVQDLENELGQGHHQPSHHDESKATSKKSTGIADMKAAFRAVLESSHDAMTSKVGNEMPHNGQNTTALVLTASALQNVKNADSSLQPAPPTKPPPCKRHFKLHALKQGKRTDEVTPAPNDQTPPIKTFSSSCGEAMFSAARFHSQEHMCCATSSVPSTRVEATAFASWKSTSQETPAINWEQAVMCQESARVDCGSKKDSALHHAIQMLLDSKQSDSSRHNFVQSMNHEDHVVMHHSYKSSDGKRLDSTVFLSRSTAFVTDYGQTEGTTTGASHPPTQDVLYLDEIHS